MSEERQQREGLDNDRALFDDKVEDCMAEIENAIESWADEEGAPWEVIDAALYTCAVQHAVDAYVEKDEFLRVMAAMYDESKEMGELEDQFSLTRGDA